MENGLDIGYRDNATDEGPAVFDEYQKLRKPDGDAVKIYHYIIIMS